MKVPWWIEEFDDSFWFCSILIVSRAKGTSHEICRKWSLIIALEANGVWYTWSPPWALLEEEALPSPFLFPSLWVSESPSLDGFKPPPPPAKLIWRYWSLEKKRLLVYFQNLNDSIDKMGGRHTKRVLRHLMKSLYSGSFVVDASKMLKHKSTAKVKNTKTNRWSPSQGTKDYVCYRLARFFMRKGTLSPSSSFSFPSWWPLGPAGSSHLLVMRGNRIKCWSRNRKKANEWE